MAEKQRVVAIFPGRGSYGHKELGYLARHHQGRHGLLEELDALRTAKGAKPSLELDALERFSPAKHLPGRNASNLIYTAALADFASIDRERYEVVAMCGNSLGWYLTLAASGALSLRDGAHLVDTMGDLMEREAGGGQLLFQVSNDDWSVDESRKAQVLELIAATENAYLSIDLGGTLVLAGDKQAIAELQAALGELGGEPPVQLPRHGAFHTPILEPITVSAREALAQEMFGAPECPIIDGRGAIWTPYSTQISSLYDYTLRTQIVETYDFALSLEVALKEFAPDRLILMGPGSSLGAPIAQALIRHRWRGVTGGDAFQQLQQVDPFLIALGRDEQRGLALPPTSGVRN